MENDLKLLATRAFTFLVSLAKALAITVEAMSKERNNFFMTVFLIFEFDVGFCLTCQK